MATTYDEWLREQERLAEAGDEAAEARVRTARILEQERMRRETIARNDARATMRDRIVNTMRTFRNQIRKATTAI